MINSRPAGRRFLWREPRLEPFPVRAGHISSVHTLEYTDQS
jgi:hypothetical protein